MPIAAGGSLVAAAATTRCLSSAAPMLRFLARLSGRRRRRHVRRPGSRAPPGPGASPASSGPAAGRGGAAAAAAAAAAASDAAAVMEEAEQQRQQPRDACCTRCRGTRACSCALLGLDAAEAGPEGARPSEPSPQQQQQPRRHPGRALQEAAAPGRQLPRRPHERELLRRRPPESPGLEETPPPQRRRRPTALALCSSAVSLIPPYLATLLILSYSLVGVADACSSRSTPKPRPPTPTPRPNITFHMYTCPPDYAEWYCLNGATCFTVKIVESLLYNCLCANGYIGQRCEFKDLDGSYLPSRQRVMLETASIAGAVTIAVFLAVITFISVYIHCKRKQKELRTSSGVDAVDGPGRDPELRPFCSRSRSLMIFMAKNPNSLMPPTIEQTRMPNWSYAPETSTRFASVNENKRPSQ